MNSPISAKSTISLNSASISFLVSPRIAPFRYTFSRPAGEDCRPKTFVSAFRISAFQLFPMPPTRPRITISPRSGGKIPAINRKSVVLPHPLRPIRPRHSPRRRSKLTLLSAQNSDGRRPSELDCRPQTADCRPFEPPEGAISASIARESAVCGLQSVVSPTEPPKMSAVCGLLLKVCGLQSAVCGLRI